MPRAFSQPTVRRHCRAILAAAAMGWFGQAAAQAQVTDPVSTPATATAPTPLPEGQRADSRRPTQPTTITLGGLPVQLTGSWEPSSEWRRNLDLNSARDRNRLVHDHELQLEARLFPAADAEVFLQAVGLYNTRRTRGTPGVDRSQRLERGQTWLKLGRLGGTPWSLQIGRLALIDRRAWWWDDDLDAVRVQVGGAGWQLDTGLAQQVARLSVADDGVAPDQRGLRRWFGTARWQLAPRHALDAFWLVAHDGSGAPAPGRLVADEDATDASDLNARWLGLRASGEHRAAAGWRLAYWADAALVRGRERRTAWAEQDDGRFAAGATTARRLRGQALDLGATLRLPPMGGPTRGPSFSPSFSLGYARGSGGERSDRLDANFRQTGLQENKARLGGVKRWRSYGELLRPELSNLAVSTLGLGLRFLDNSSVELVAHGYRQPVPQTSLPGARLSTAPLGLNGDIGHEVDLLLALREWQHWEFTVALARFRPGAAFAPNRRDAAHSLELGAALNF